MDRRRFIKTTGAASVAALGVAGQAQGGLGGRDYHIVNNLAALQGKSKVDADTSVLIVGGGIAGLTAAHDLAKKGYRVTVRESENYLGGRLHTRSEDLKTGSFQVEHGLHMWFKQYYNFERILRELGVWERYFVDFKEIFFQFENYKNELIKK